MNRYKKKITCAAVLGVLALCVLSLGGYYLWSNIKPSPKPTREMLFQGVEYIRDVRSSPRPMVIHIVKVDLQADGIRPFVTPGDPEAEDPLRARTTSDFLDDFAVQVAVNGDGFTPWHANTIFDYYPHTGDPISPLGMAASDGVLYQDISDYPTLFIGPNNQARINSQTGRLHQAISGNAVLLKNGSIQGNLAGNSEPRTAVALNRANSVLILIVVDGRQPGYSEGATLTELAEITQSYGGYTAINLDGGGSSTLVVQGPLGIPSVLNSPIHNGIPGRQRPVGNHLGIFAKPIK